MLVTQGILAVRVKRHAVRTNEQHRAGVQGHITGNLLGHVAGALTESRPQLIGNGFITDQPVGQRVVH